MTVNSIQECPCPNMESGRCMCKYVTHGEEMASTVQVTHLSFFDLFLIVFGQLLYMYDVGSDVYVAYVYWMGSWKTQFQLTLITILWPSFVTALFRLRGNQMHARHISTTRKILDFISTLFQLMPLLATIEYFWYAFNDYFFGRRISWSKGKKLNPNWFNERVIWLIASIAIMRLIESFIEAIPQISLQCYFAMQQLNDTNGPMGGTVSWGIYQSVATSLVSCSWSICFAFMTFAYGSSITATFRTPIPSLCLMFVGYLCIISSRFYCLEYLLVTSVPMFLSFCLAHWIFVIVWIYVGDYYNPNCIRRSSFLKFLGNVVRAFSFIFVFSQILPKRFATSKAFWTSHIIMFIENLVICILCYLYGSSFGGFISYQWFSVDALCLIVIPQLIYTMGILCLVLQNVHWGRVRLGDEKERAFIKEIIEKLVVRVMGITWNMDIEDDSSSSVSSDRIAEECQLVPNNGQICSNGNSVPRA